jgi:aldose 1-epimerase
VVITLRNDHATAVIDPSTGGRLVSLLIDGHEVMGSIPDYVLDDILANAPDRHHDWYRGSFPLAPWAGDLPGGTFHFDRARYDIDRDSSGIAAHGVVAESAWSIVENPPTRTSLTLRIPFGPELPGRWPFDGFARQTFVLDDPTLMLRLEVHSSRGRMPAIAGFHPWFRREMDDGAAASVDFSPQKRLVWRGDRLVATDDLGERPWDDLFVGLQRSPRISWPGGPILTLESTASIWVYYERTPIAFCLEPWTGPSGGLETEWAFIVTPKNPLILDFTIRFGY